ncbi:relaxase domain-containing protein [Arsenicicoccus sp. MKL-02]|uniref:Relaxase domain-containing protein n=2 Tax=Arsenicicoccus cauae TaxID=2663847 RepID=A0A6I3IA87_9MICO|nr:relaxase domain-containing protein [Arsenicicoccus cauae]
MHAGQGVDYLLRTVAVGDGDRSLRDPLTRYYAEEGTPPGYWLGSGVASLDSELKVGDEVAEEHLRRLIGHGQHPVTGEQLGSRFRTFAQPKAGKRKHAVAGFDMTFSIPKSASILWVVADAGTQAIIADAHHRAVEEALDFVEREIVATRAGASGPGGSVVHLDTTGVVATAFDHYDSRANDPHLHTHVVISNKVKTVRDGKWRTLDGTPLHHWTVAVSELHEAIFSDHLTRALGVDWERRARGRDRNPAWEIAGVRHQLVAAFSQRSRDIDAATEAAIEEYVAQHGRQPKRSTVNKLRQTANLTTRPPKHRHSLADLTAGWRRRATDLLGEDATTWARNTLTNTPQRLLRADDIPLDLIEEVGRSVVIAVGEKRSTWRRANLYAETARQTLGWRFASARDREAITGLIVEAAEQGSMRLTPPDLATTPAAFTRNDGTSEFRPKHSTVFSAEHLLAAEDRLLKRADAITAPTVDIEIVDAITEQPVKGHRLSPEQAQAIATVAVSGRNLDLLVGPAGAGKTTALRALKQAWTHQHGRNGVVGLAPSAAAAAVLAEELGIGTENTAKWLYEHQQGHAHFSRGQLVIIDEASLAGTLTLDRITAHADQAGAKVLLVGDWAQLQSVEAGGAFGMLVEARDDAPELVDIHRFTNEWEKLASLDLRHGRAEIIDTYIDHGRVDDGTGESMTETAYAAWKHDIDHGRASILIADNSGTVRDLNIRAQTERGAGHGRAVTLIDGTNATTGDWIITRKNDRRLRTLRNGWVRNGDRWTVKDVRPDGSLVVRRQDRHSGAVVLPAAYVAEHVDLGYAITAHRAQGITVDTSRVVVTESTTRENLYVAMTRGREHNHAHVITGNTDDNHGTPDEQDAATAREVLTGVLANVGAELSATQTIEAEQEAWGGTRQLAAELETLAAAAQRDRWARLLARCGLTEEQRYDILASDAYGTFAAELRRAEANGHDVNRILPVAVNRYGLGDADDVAAVLRHRLRLATTDAGSRQSRRPARLIAGLIPEPIGPMAPDVRKAIDERKVLIEQRAKTLADTAIRRRESWIQQIGDPPAVDRADWMRNVVTIAAYRDRYGITSRDPLGGQAVDDNQRLDRARAVAALRSASTTGLHSFSQTLASGPPILDRP